MNYAPNLSPQEIHAAHTRFADSLSANLPSPHPPPFTDPNPDRPIRLGIIIPDLTRHSVAYFIRPVLERLDPAQFTLFIYYTGTPRPNKTSRSQNPAAAGLTPEWPIPPHAARFIAWDPLPKLDSTVRADRLHMLIDLCGMSSAHRLQLMHLKPAPIELTYAGYPNTTGLSSIDYRIVDSHTDPAGSESLATEELLRLDPCFLCYTPPTDAPELPPRADSARAITFGSFNHLPKLNDPLISLWTRILSAVPNSRLVLKAQGLHHADTRADLLARFTSAGAAAGVSPDRVTLLPPTDTRADHLNTYAQIDIALDPFPYHGTTTTCEALFMGVPVVTLAGNTHVSRVGVSLLNNAGLPDLIAESPDDYIVIATNLAADTHRLQMLRANLRSEVLSSPLCDAASFSDRFQSLLRTIWRNHCQPSR